MHIKKAFYTDKERVFVLTDGRILRYIQLPYQSKHRYGGMRKDAQKVEIK